MGGSDPAEMTQENNHLFKRYKLHVSGANAAMFNGQSGETGPSHASSRQHGLSQLLKVAKVVRSRL